jgi:hypothetical protein
MCFPKNSKTKVITITEIVTFMANAFLSFDVASFVTVKKTDNTKNGVIIKNIFKNVEIKISIKLS